MDSVGRPMPISVARSGTQPLGALKRKKVAEAAFLLRVACLLIETTSRV